MKKVILITSSLSVFVICVLLLPFIVIVGVVFGSNMSSDEITTNYKLDGVVSNNQMYASKYKFVLNKYLADKGYVSLERLVFYLQHTQKIANVAGLSNKIWSQAYLANINEQEKQMIPIAEICSTIDTSSISSNGNIEIINLCAGSNNLENKYKSLPFSFPLKSKFTVTSFTYEQRNVYGKSDIHNGWDFAVPINTSFYSICDGTVTSVVNTQPNDLPYNKSKNNIGNYIKVKCYNGLTAIYYHIKYKSSSFAKNDEVSSGDLLGKTSTTGYSTGPHLHLGLEDVNGNIIDPMNFINMKTFEIRKK